MARPSRSSWLFTGVLCACIALAAAAHAQERRARLGVVTRPGLSHALQATVQRILSDRYNVIGLGASTHPRPAEDLQDSIEDRHVELVLILSKHGNLLAVRFFDAQSTEEQGIVRLYARDDKLAESTARKLLSAIDARVARLPRGSSRDASAERSTGPRKQATTRAMEPSEEPTEDTEPEARMGRRSPAAPAASEDDEEPEPERTTAAESVTADEASEPALEEGAATERETGLSLLASVGSSTYSAEFRTQDGKRAIEGGTAFAVGLGAGFAFGTAAEAHWAIQARYMTSIGRQVDELHQDGVPQKMSLRTHRFESDLGRYIPLGSGWSLAPALGYALRSVMPEVHFQLLPFYTLGGPYLRVQLSTPAIGSRVGLRFTPELQWLPQASAVVGGASISAARFALSGQVVLFVHLEAKLDLELSLHESHAYGQATEPEIDDVHRFIFASVLWRP